VENLTAQSININNNVVMYITSFLFCWKYHRSTFLIIIKA